LFYFLFRRAGDRARLLVGHDDLDGILDPISCISKRGGEVGEWKCVGVNPGRIETLFRHEFHRAVGGAATLTANAIDIDIVPDEMRNIRRYRLVRERGEADFPASIGHADGLVDGCFRAGAFDHIIRADPAGELFYDTDRILVVDIDDAISP